MADQMLPEDFYAKWESVADDALNEIQVYQSHFKDVCRLIGHPEPFDLDKKIRDTIFAFEQPVDGGKRADVYLQEHFIFEYKKPSKYKNLKMAIQQAEGYAVRLGNPPLLIATDVKNWFIRTNFPTRDNYDIEFTDEDILNNAYYRRLLRQAFFTPDAFHPDLDAEKVTVAAAKSFKKIVDSMRTEEWASTPNNIATLHRFSKEG